MKTLMERFSFWWGEKVAETEDNCEEAVVPLADGTFDRLGQVAAAVQQRLQHITRGGGPRQRAG